MGSDSMRAFLEEKEAYEIFNLAAWPLWNDACALIVLRCDEKRCKLIQQLAKGSVKTHLVDSHTIVLYKYDWALELYKAAQQIEDPRLRVALVALLTGGAPRSIHDTLEWIEDESEEALEIALLEAGLLSEEHGNGQGNTGV